MTQASSADWEITIVLPLGVVANQLRRIEAQLRVLNMKALGFARERENRALRAAIEGRLNEINEALGSITGLVSDIEADIQPGSANGDRTSTEEPFASVRHRDRIDEPPLPRDTQAGGVRSSRKPSVDRDD